MKNILKLEYVYMEKIWGYEKWIASTHKNGISLIHGEDKNLLEYLGKELPILIKEIKSDESLSVQVHPSDDYANKYEGDNGKTECWFILDAKENASLICGIEEGLSREKLEELINNRDVEKILKRISIKAGDMIYIPAGTVHAIEGGIKLLEVQECSDITYRIYDWGRDREVHIQKALDVINFTNNNDAGLIRDFKILKTNYFTVEKILVKEKNDFECTKDYNIYHCINGDGVIVENTGETLSISKGDSIYISKGSKYTIDGSLEMLSIY